MRCFPNFLIGDCLPSFLVSLLELFAVAGALVAAAAGHLLRTSMGSGQAAIEGSPNQFESEQLFLGGASVGDADFDGGACGRLDW